MKERRTEGTGKKEKGRKEKRGSVVVSDTRIKDPSDNLFVFSFFFFEGNRSPLNFTISIRISLIISQSVVLCSYMCNDIVGSFVDWVHINHKLLLKVFRYSRFDIELS